ncbi:glycosyltransferase [Neobacillus sp. MER 74]|uniref:glycosyltransferase family 2 protein n=1 Tax=Neobacillus sp. MER 74 TaxID=2939566 RepID=UPI00203A66F9|nr:glycosyltransferase [Neobacillus sp. MER 74]MCM3116044.1 glycosyltransferase [Neobacillus sp. MER 74]
MKPLISVIVPVYNVEKYVGNCLNSILAQTYENIEVIVVNDGTKDNSAVICEEIAKRDSRVKVLHKINAGLGFARNTGLDAANGEYVVFIDSDDFIDKNMIEKLYTALSENNADTCYCGYRRFYSSDKIIDFPAYYNNELFVGEEIIEKVLLEMIASEPHVKTERLLSMSVWHALYSMKLIKKYNLRFPSEREFISEDIIFHIAYLQKANRVYFIQDSLYFYRCNEGSLTQVYLKDEFERHKKLINEINFRLKEFLPSKKFMLRTQRYFLGRVRSCLAKEIAFNEKEKSRDFKSNMNLILNDDMVRSTIDAYPYNRNKFVLRVYNHMIKTKNITLITLLTKIREKV